MNSVNRLPACICMLSTSTEINLLKFAMFDNFDGDGKEDFIFGEYSIMILVCEKNEIVLFIES